MSKEHGLGKLTIIYAIGNFGSKGLSFILMFFMTYYLSKKEIGEYDLILTTLSLIVPCVSLSIDFAVFRWLLDPKQKENINKIFENVFGLLQYNIAIYSFFFWLMTYYMDIVSYRYTLIYILSILMISLPTLLQGTRGIGKNHLYTIANILYSIIYVLSTISFLYFTNLKIEGILIANILSVLIIILVLLLKNKWWRYFKFFQIEKQQIKDLCGYSLPLLPNTLSWWLISYSTRYVILIYLGQEYNGVFSISYKYPTILLVLADVFSMAWQEKLIKIENQQEAEIQCNQTLSKYINLIFGVVIILCASSKMLMKLVDPDFFEAWKYIPVLLYAVLLQAIASFYGAIYLRVKRTKDVLYSSLTGGVIAISTSFFLVKFGLYGISFSVLLGFLSMLLFRIVDTRKFAAIQFPVIKFALLSFVFALVTLTLFFEEIWASVLVLGLTCVIFLGLNNVLIKKYSTSILNRLQKT